MNPVFEVLSSIIIFLSVATLLISFKKPIFVLLISVCFHGLLFGLVPEYGLITWNIFFVIYVFFAYCIWKKTMDESLTTEEMLQKNKMVFFNLSGNGFGWLIGNFTWAIIEKGTYTMESVNLPMHTGVVFCFLVYLILNERLISITKKKKEEKKEGEQIDIKINHEIEETHSCGSHMRVFRPDSEKETLKEVKKKEKIFKL